MNFIAMDGRINLAVLEKIKSSSSNDTEDLMHYEVGFPQRRFASTRGAGA